MLGRSLEPVRLGVPGDRGELAQSFFLSYLAYYAGAAIAGRTHQAYSLAWGYDQIHRFARVEGGRPAFVAAVFTYPWGKHVVVAFEGLTSLPQLWTLANGADLMVGNAPLSGYVKGFIREYADAALALIAANGSLNTTMNTGTTEITFAGFSLGACIAEVCAYVWRSTHQSQTIRLRKFAAPRFANSTWNENRDTRVDVRCVYLQHDPVHRLFYGGLARSSGSLFSLPTGTSMPQLDPRREAWDFEGAPAAPPQDMPIQGTLNAYGAMLRPLDPTNFWFFHQRHTYRQMWCRYAAAGTDRLRLRVLHLEHPDENAWQRRVLEGGFWAFSWLVLDDPAPEEYVEVQPAQADEMARGHNFPAHPPKPEAPEQRPLGHLQVIDTETAMQRRRARHIPVGVP